MVNSLDLGLEGKVAIVAGGGGDLKGIGNGRAASILLAEAGAKVVVADREDFLAMKPLFKWQLLGDFIKIALVIIAHQFFAKKMVKQFIVTELII